MSTTTVPLTSTQNGLLWAFFSLHIVGGHILIPLLLGLSIWRQRDGARNYVSYNFFFTWLLYSITFTLLLYAGQQTGPEPTWNICRTQAALVYAVPILVATASCTLVFQLFMDIRATESNKIIQRNFFSMRNLVLICFPYVLAAGYLIGPSVVAIGARKTISRSNALFYCSSNLRALTVVSATSVGVIFLITVIMEVLIARMLAKRARIEQLGSWWKASGFFVRIALFTAYLLFSVAACGVEISQPSSPFRIIVQACGPLIVFAVFGTTPALWSFARVSRISVSLSDSRTSRTSDKSTTPFYQPVTTSVA